MMTRTLISTLCAAAMATFVAAAPNTTSACGGTFCDAGPSAMPVDQTGEVILFVMGEDFTEAHIQILYDPTSTAEKFAWVVPVQSVPEFSVGSQLLFDNMLQATVPAYGFTTTFEDCGNFGDGGSGLTGSGSDDGAGGDEGTDGGDGGPEVVLEETVGAFEVAVLQGGTADEVMTWLADNGYEQDPAAMPILGEYLDEDYLFAAFKLTNGAELAEIHPVTLRFDNTAEACVPIRLTRIAAAEDMDVRSFYLANDRVAPRNYRHVVVNPLKLDWPNQAANYKEVITLAVDAENADGKAFVTEYAGSSNRVSSAGLFSPSWDSTMFDVIDPVLVVDELMAQNILYCDEFFCEFYHPLIESLLAQWLPRPAGLSKEEFWGCLSCHMDMIDMTVWNGMEFAAAYQERIIDPGRNAAQLLQDWGYLTRMYTTISPGEMTEDPFFHVNPDLPDVDNTSQFAQQTIRCDDDSVWTLPDGREVYVPSGQSWPEFPDEMPWEEEVAVVPPKGAPMVLSARTEEIDVLLAEYNCENNWPSKKACGNDDGGALAGCSCTTGSGFPLAGLAGFVLVGLAARRRRFDHR